MDCDSPWKNISVGPANAGPGLAIRRYRHDSFHFLIENALHTRTRRLAISLESDLFMALRATRRVSTIPTESRLISRTAISSSMRVTPAE